MRLPLRPQLLLNWAVNRLHLGWAYVAFAFRPHRRASYVRERWEGGERLAGARRVAVFAHYDRRGIVHDFVLYHLEQLRSLGFAIVFVSNAPRLPPEQVERVRGLCALVIRRDNVGYDFGAYKEGIGLVPDVAALDILLLANDSVYGPLHDLAQVLDRMNPAAADMWGASDSWEHSFHLQSYFLVFHRQALATPAFRTFWERVRYVPSKTWIVRCYEVGLTRALRRAGLRCRAAYPYRTVAAALVEAVVERNAAGEATEPVRRGYLQQVFRAVDAGVPLNATHFFWDYLIARMDFPFLKRDLLQKNPAHIPLLNYWEEVVKRSSDYDTDLILRHLEVSLRNRSV